MSGGYFNYNEVSLAEISEQLHKLLREESHKFSLETLATLKNTYVYTELAYAYLCNVDKFLSADISEHSLHSRIERDTLRVFIDTQEFFEDVNK